MAKTSKSGSGKQPDDSNATSETMAFIRSLHTKYDQANLKLSQLVANLSNLQIQQKNIGEEYTRARTEEKTAKSNLKQAEAALESVDTILSFFKTRKKTTEDLVNYAYDAAHAMFLSLYQLKEQGLERVEEIKKIVVGTETASAPTAQGTTDPTKDVHWTQIFARTVTEADAQGVAAFNAGATAVQDVFKAYVSNQEIHARTVNYYNRFLKLEGEFRKIIHFKQNELSLIRKKFIILDGKNTVIDAQVAELTNLVAQQNFLVAQLQAEYVAAQQGAEYKYVPPTAPAA